MNSNKIKNRLRQSWQPLNRFSKQVIIGVGMATLASSGTASGENNNTSEFLADPKTVYEEKSTSKIAGKYTLKRTTLADMNFGHVSHSSHSSHSSHYSSSGGGSSSHYSSSGGTYTPQYDYSTPNPTSYPTPSPVATVSPTPKPVLKSSTLKMTISNTNANLQPVSNTPVPPSQVQLISTSEPNKTISQGNGFSWGWLGLLGLLGLFGLLPRNRQDKNRKYPKV